MAFHLLYPKGLHPFRMEYASAEGVIAILTSSQLHPLYTTTVYIYNSSIYRHCKYAIGPFQGRRGHKDPTESLGRHSAVCAFSQVLT